MPFSPSMKEMRDVYHDVRLPVRITIPKGRKRIEKGTHAVHCVHIAGVVGSEHCAGRGPDLLDIGSFDGIVLNRDLIGFA